MASQQPTDGQSTNVEETTAINPTDVIAKFLLDFTPENVVLWFKIAESIFAASGVTEDKSKYNYALQLIDLNSLSLVEDILINPPEENKYEHLKNELTKRLTELNKRRIAKKLMDSEEIGNRIPSEYLSVLQKDAGVSCYFDPQIADFVVTQWKVRLPSCIQVVLHCFKTATTNELVTAADVLYEIYQEKQEIVKIRDFTQDLKAEIDALSEKFRRLNPIIRSRSKSRRSRRSRSLSATRMSEYHHNKFCWYHQNFGASSSKCRKPCMWTTKN